MLNWFQALMPREDRLFPMFGGHAATLVAGAEALRDLLNGTCPPAEGCDRIVRHEHEADTITAEVLMAVRRYFITPFDRGDIKDLKNAMDDSIDQMQKTAKAITIFEVDTFQPQMRAIGDLVVRASKLIAEAIALLGSMKMNAARLNAITEEVIKLEGESDDLHDQGIKALFKGPGQASPMEYIVGNEIYDHLEKVLDRFEDVANRVSGILIESV
jgi:uncharacterized protein Yka (UPF0111/DUF47 family)